MSGQRPSRSLSRSAAPQRARSASRPRYAPPPVYNNNNKKKSAFFTDVNFGDAFNDVFNNVTSIPFKPSFLVTAFLTAFIIMSSGPKYDHGVIATILGNTNNTLTQWLYSHPNDFTGMLVALPYSFAVPDASMFSYMVAAFCLVSLVPETTLYTYVILFLALFMFFKSNNRNTRFVLFLISVGAYFTGWLVFGPDVGIALGSSNANMTWNSYRK